MNQQTLLFDVLERGIQAEPELPPHNHTETSKAAAESMRDHVTEQEAIVIKAIRSAGSDGMTCDKAEIETGLSHQSCSARIRGLAKAGLIREIYIRDGQMLKTGEVLKRKTRSGRRAVVWIAVEFAGEA